MVIIAMINALLMKGHGWTQNKMNIQSIIYPTIIF